MWLLPFAQEYLTFLEPINAKKLFVNDLNFDLVEIEIISYGQKARVSALSVAAYIANDEQHPKEPGILNYYTRCDSYPTTFWIIS